MTNPNVDPRCACNEAMNAKILAWLHTNQPLTRAQALAELGCHNLPARIAQLRRTNEIRTTYYPGPVEGLMVAAYTYERTLTPDEIDRLTRKRRARRRGGKVRAEVPGQMTLFKEG